MIIAKIKLVGLLRKYKPTLDLLKVFPCKYRIIFNEKVRAGSVSVRLKLISMFCVVALGVTAVSYWILQRSQGDLIHTEAERIARIVSIQVLADREVYTKSLVDKLTTDGFGADARAHFRPGYIMLPAEFIRRVAKKVERTAGDHYSYNLISKWNINPEQGLKSEFEKKAWVELSEQEIRLGPNARARLESWQPVSAVIMKEGKPVLSYMQADIASSMACVNCHNALEAQPDIISMRTSTGDTATKKWELYDLMGAVRVDVPLASVIEIASDGRATLLTWLVVVFLAGFLLINFFLYEAIVKPSEEASRIKGQFLANMSHEIRTPLNGVVGMTEFLVESSPTIEQQGYIRTLKQSSETLIDIVNDILDFSKIESGGLKLENLSFNLRELLQEIAEQSLPQATDKGLEILIDFPQALPEFIVGDRSRMRQIILNLVGNALKFTDHGHILISVAKKASASDPRLIIGVEDTGIGIAKQKQSVIFDQFKQVDDSNTRAKGGTGLGLSISKQLANLMEGNLGVKSEPGAGSLFEVDFPLVESDAARSSEDSIELSKGLLFGTRVLIVDDNKISAEILQKMLVHAGAQALNASNAEDAITILDKAVDDCALPDIIVIDQVMPAVQGDELGLRIGANAQLAEIPKILITSMPLRGEAETRQAQGFAAYLVKPLNTPDFLEVCSTLLDQTSTKEKSNPGIITVFNLARVEAEDRRGKSGFDGARVLLAEDNPVNAMVAAKMMEQFGIEVTTANNGAEAVELSQKQQYNLILMDYHMPVMDGLTATRHLRESGCRIPIIALSAAVLAEERAACLEAGMNDFLAKPLQKSELRSMLSAWLGFGD